MKYDFLQYLVCPQTGESLDLKVYEERDGQVKEGQLTSVQSGHVYPITNFVPRFVKSEQYTGSFSKQRLFVRRHFKDYKVDCSGDRLFYPTTGFTREKLLSGLTLEVGCGYGRFVDVIQRQGGEIVGIDLSTHSIDLAQDFVGLRSGVHLVQCDLFRLPFRNRTFNSIYSVGVLHHTADCKAAFQRLADFLAKDGQISIWVYHPHNQSDVAAWRRLTTKWPSSVLYAWCIANQLLFSWMRMIPVVRWQFNKLIPGSVPKTGQNFWLRVMEDFDNLSPTYASSHTPDEVVKWFREVGLSDIRVLDRLTAVTGLLRV